jgi:hypothetical protein
VDGYSSTQLCFCDGSCALDFWPVFLLGVVCGVLQGVLGKMGEKTWYFGGEFVVNCVVIVVF